MSSETGTGLLDEVTGGGGLLLLGGPGDGAALDDGRRVALAAVGIRVLEIVREPRSGGSVDVDAHYETWLGGFGATAMLVRPDFYVYGVEQGADEVCTLVDDFLGDLRGGSRQPAVRPVGVRITP